MPLLTRGPPLAVVLVLALALALALVPVLAQALMPAWALVLALALVLVMALAPALLVYLHLISHLIACWNLTTQSNHFLLLQVFRYQFHYGIALPPPPSSWGPLPPRLVSWSCHAWTH